MPWYWQMQGQLLCNRNGACSALLRQLLTRLCAGKGRPAAISLFLFRL